MCIAARPNSRKSCAGGLAEDIQSDRFDGEDVSNLIGAR